MLLEHTYIYFPSLYIGENEEELSVKAGEDVAVIEDLGDGWLRVRRSNNEEGYVPQSYVQVK